MPKGKRSTRPKPDELLAEARRARTRLGKLVETLDSLIAYAEEFGTGANAEIAALLHQTIEAADRAWTRNLGFHDQSSPAVVAHALRLLEIGRHFYELHSAGDVPERMRCETPAQALAVASDHVARLVAEDREGLSRIPINDWAHAIERWPGVKRGGSRKRESARQVAFDLLKPHGLTNAADADGLWETYSGSARRARRPSRAKT